MYVKLEQIFSASSESAITIHTVLHVSKA